MSRYKTIKKYNSFFRFLKNSKRSLTKAINSYIVLIFWLRNNTTRNQFLIFSGVLVGLSSGLAGVLLKLIVHYIHFLITSKVHFEQQLVFYTLFPFAGIVITTIVVVYFFKGQDRKGIGTILFEIAKHSSRVSPVKMYSQIVQSAITVGLGGSAGLESPIAVTGAAIGSNFAQTYKLDYKERTLLLAAGATAGIAAAFNAPIAGMMFAFEILLAGVVFSDFIPLAVAAICGSLLSRIILREEVLFQFTARNAFDYHNIPFYLIFAFVCAFYARYFVLVARFIEHKFQQLAISKIQRAIIAGSLLSLLCVALPPLFGEGYSAVKALNNGEIKEIIENSFFRYFEYRQWIVILFLVLVVLLKAFATPITIFGGGNGGNFAPSLFAGGFLGYLFSLVCTQLGFAHVPVTNLVIVGMAGVMSGVMYAPLTAIFLIAESSSGYDLFIPLMIVAVISFLIAKWFSPYHPELKLLAEEGKIFTREHDKNLLSLLDITELIDKDYESIDIDAAPAVLMQLFKNGKQNTIAVLSDKKLLGIITINEIRPLFFSEELPKNINVVKLMKAAPFVIKNDENIGIILKYLDETSSNELPVINDLGNFMGFISKEAILNKYRRLLQEYS